jgi:hypothetical protein
MGFFPEQVQVLCRLSRPARIDELWESQQLNSHSNNTTLCTEHLLADHLDLWASSNEISDLLLDNDRLQNLVNQLYESSVFIGQICQANTSSESPLVLVVALCDQCNTPYDVGNYQHLNSPPREILMEPQVSLHVHLTVVTLSIIANLLTKSNADKLVLVLTRERPGYDATQTQVVEWLHEGHVSKKPCILPALVGLIDNCSNAFPKAGQLAAGVVSLIICRRPAVALNTLDGDMFITSAAQYLEKVFMLIHNTECSVEQNFGVVAFLNILPALYHLGNWTAQHERLQRGLVALLTTILVNICHNATIAEDGQEQDDFFDQAPNLEEFPELLQAKILMEPLLYRDGDTTQDSTIAGTTDKKWRARVLKQRPMSFAVAGGLEILAWWATHGVDLSEGMIETNDSSPAISVPGALGEYQERIGRLAERTPRLAFINMITDDIFKGRKPPHPTRKDSLLYGPLIYADRRCGLVSCRKLEAVRGGELMRCSGGCGGLEHYCCKEHQKDHWDLHKRFCKMNKVAAQL